MSIKRLFFNAVLACSVFMILGVGMAFAASAAYNVVEETATVGTGAAMTIEYTVGSVPQIWADGDTLTLTLPDNYPTWGAIGTYFVEHDDNGTDNGAGNDDDVSETEITIGGGNGQYAVTGDREITIKMDDTTWTIDADDVIRVYVAAAANIPTYADDTSTFTFGGTTADVGDEDPLGTDNVSVSAAAAAATLSITPATAGDGMTGTLGFTLPVAMASGDTVAFTMPDAFVLTSASFGYSSSSQTFGGAGEFACSDTGQLVTCTADDVVDAGTGAITLVNFFSKAATSANISNFMVSDTSASAPTAEGLGSIDGTHGATTNVTVGALTSTNVEPALYSNSTITQATVSFTSTAPIPTSGGTIKVTFPSGWDVSAVNSGTAVSGVSGALTVTNSGQVVTIDPAVGVVASPSAAVAVSFTLANVRTPAATGSGGTYTILTTSDGTIEVETDASVTADTIYASSTSAEVTIGTPTGLTVTDNPDGDGVVLTWTDPSGDDTTAIEILRGVDPIPVSASALTSVALGVETYTDTDLEAGDVVTYQLRASGSGTTGTITDELTFTVGSGETVVDESTTDETTDETTEEGTTDETTDEGTTDETIDEDTTDETALTDVADHWAVDEIEYMVEAGVVEGDPEGTFRPDESLNRAEAATLLHRVLGVGDPADVTENPFGDVDHSEWYAPYVAALLDLALVSGNPDGTYQPGENINRAEFLTLAMNVYEYMMGDVTDVDMTDAYVDLDTDAWYAQTVANATSLGFVEGSAGEGGQYFNADSEITRAEATAILYRMFAVELASR